jgi:hypothetical protein
MKNNTITNIIIININNKPNRSIVLLPYITDTVTDTANGYASYHLIEGLASYHLIEGLASYHLIERL